jgi:hypothetical protein
VEEGTIVMEEKCACRLVPQPPPVPPERVHVSHQHIHAQVKLEPMDLQQHDTGQC